MNRSAALLSKASKLRLGVDGICSEATSGRIVASSWTVGAPTRRHPDMPAEVPSSGATALGHPFVTLGPRGLLLNPFSSKLASGAVPRDAETAEAVINGLFAWVSGKSGKDPMEMPRQDVPASNPDKEGVPSDAPTSPDASNPEVDKSDYTAPGTNPDVKGNNANQYKPDPKQMPGQHETPEQHKQAASARAGVEVGRMTVTFCHTQPETVEATHLEMATWANEAQVPVKVESVIGNCPPAQPCPGPVAEQLEGAEWVATAPVETLLETKLAESDQPIGRVAEDDNPPGYDADPNVVPPTESDVGEGHRQPKEGGTDAENNSGSTSNAVQEDLDIHKSDKDDDVGDDYRVAPNAPGPQVDSEFPPRARGGDADSQPTGTPADIGPEQAGG